MGVQGGLEDQTGIQGQRSYKGSVADAFLLINASPLNRPWSIPNYRWRQIRQGRLLARVIKSLTLSLRYEIVKHSAGQE